MNEKDRNKESKKELNRNGNSIPLLNLIMENEISIKGKVISKVEKEYINKIIEQIYGISWGQEDARLKMMFDLSLIIDKLKEL